MKKVVSILVFLGMGAFVSAQAIYDNLGLPKICKEIESPFALNDKGRLYFGDTTSIEFREKMCVEILMFLIKKVGIVLILNLI